MDNIHSDTVFNIYPVSASVEGASHTHSRLPGLAKKKAYCVLYGRTPSMVCATDFILAIVLSSHGSCRRKMEVVGLKSYTPKRVANICTCHAHFCSRTH